MHVKLSRWVPNDVLVVLWVVTTEKGPESVTKIAVDVTVLIQRAIVAQNDNGRLHIVFIEGSGLSHKAFHQAFVALGEHGRDRIPLGREVEEQEIVVLLVHQTRTALRDIDVRDFVLLF